MKKLLSLTLMLSLGLATISPALNAAQAQKGSSTPAWTKSSGFAAAKKWWKAGRDINALSPQEQKAFSALKAKVGITAIVAILTAILVKNKKTITNKIKQARMELLARTGTKVEKAAVAVLQNMRGFGDDGLAHELLKDLTPEEYNQVIPTAMSIRKQLQLWSHIPDDGFKILLEHEVPKKL